MCCRRALPHAVGRLVRSQHGLGLGYCIVRHGLAEQWFTSSMMCDRFPSFREPKAPPVWQCAGLGALCPGHCLLVGRCCAYLQQHTSRAGYETLVAVDNMSQHCEVSPHSLLVVRGHAKTCTGFKRRTKWHTMASSHSSSSHHQFDESIFVCKSCMFCRYCHRAHVRAGCSM